MAEYEVVHVAVAAPAVLDEGLVRKVSEIIGKNLYETRLRLTGKIPKIIANYSTMQLAELAAQILRGLGLIVIVFSDSELRKPWHIYKARNLKFEEQAITFYDRNGQAKRMEAGEAFLILSGRMEAYTEKEVTKTVKKLNLGLTLLTGGIPITKNVKEKTVSKSFQKESYLRLYYRTSPELAIEIVQHDFDYSFLGTEMVASATANFSIAIKKIREALPQAIFDDRLIEPFGADMPAAMQQDNIESNCKLFYWYHRAISEACTSIQTQPG
ncbi:MAG: hypothetical protein MUO89_06765 [Dehalococcoidia bacterium]|nr:hypothetical protein [Dehalococcoidia bacterium]